MQHAHNLLPFASAAARGLLVRPDPRCCMLLNLQWLFTERCFKCKKARFNDHISKGVHNMSVQLQALQRGHGKQCLRQLQSILLSRAS